MSQTSVEGGRARTLPLPADVSGAAPGARLVSEIVSGLIAGAFVISFTLSLAALVFAGDAARYLPAGIGLLLVSSFVLGLVISLGSGFRPVTAAAQDNTGVILAIVVADVARRAAPGPGVLPTIVASLAATTLVTGLAFYLLGRFRLGKIVRFMPYPVIAGFLAGTGFLLVQGSLGVMTGLSIGLHSLPALATREACAQWVPGVAFGLTLAIVLRRAKHPAVVPALLLGAFALFYAVVQATGIGLAGAAARGLLLGPFPQGGAWPPIGPEDLALVDLRFFTANAGNAFACVLLAVIASLLNASGYEIATDQEIDQDRELRVHGLANALSGLAGGAPGYMMLGGSTLSFRSGARTRIAGALAAGACLVPLAFGTSVLGYFPKPVLAGLLFYLGISFLLENVVESYARLRRGEYALVLLILAVVVGVGFLQGVGFGIVVSSFVFALNYARVEVVKHEISGASVRSKASRSMADEATLRARGGEVHVLVLQGYVFFGTAHALLQRVKARLAAPGPKVALLVLDFRHVPDLDASAAVGFVRIAKLAAASGAELVFTDLREGVRAQLARAGCLEGPDAGAGTSARVFPDLDRGLEHCEDRLVATSDREAPASQIQAAITKIVRDRGLVTRLVAYFEPVHLEAGRELFAAGDEASDLYFVESGECEASIEVAGGKRRLRSMGAGTVVGESALYLGARRSAAVHTTKPSVLLRLTGAALDEMTAKEPELAAAFHRFVAATLADRMVTATSATQMLFN